jgi:hypothetical protein
MKILPMYEEIQKGYQFIYTAGLPNYEEMRKYLTIYEEAVSHI